jgi:hypothetical protein
MSKRTHARQLVPCRCLLDFLIFEIGIAIGINWSRLCSVSSKILRHVVASSTKSAQHPAIRSGSNVHFFISKSHRFDPDSDSDFDLEFLHPTAVIRPGRDSASGLQHLVGLPSYDFQRWMQPYHFDCTFVPIVLRNASCSATTFVQ